MSSSPLRTSLYADEHPTPVSRICVEPSCPHREQLRQEQMRCARLAAANQVLRDAQQFLLGKCAAAAENANTLALELDALRRDRESQNESIRDERAALRQHKDELDRRVQQMDALEQTLMSSKKQIMNLNNENSLMREQIVSLQDSLNRMTERVSVLAASNDRSEQQDRPIIEPSPARRSSSSERRANTPDRTNAQTAGRRTYGTLSYSTGEPAPANFYHSPSRNFAVLEQPLRSATPTRRSSSRESRGTPPPPPPHNTSGGKVSPQRRIDRLFLPGMIHPAREPQTDDAVVPMKAALDIMKHVTSGISHSLPLLSGRSATDSPSGVAAAEAFLKEYEAAFHAKSSGKQQGESSTSPHILGTQQQGLSGAVKGDSLSHQKFEIDKGLTVHDAIKKFQGDIPPPPPPPPPPHDDDDDAESPERPTTSSDYASSRLNIIPTYSTKVSDMRQRSKTYTTPTQRVLDNLATAPIPSTVTPPVAFTTARASATAQTHSHPNFEEYSPPK